MDKNELKKFRKILLYLIEKDASVQNAFLNLVNNADSIEKMCSVLDSDIKMADIKKEYEKKLDDLQKRFDDKSERVVELENQLKDIKSEVNDSKNKRTEAEKERDRYKKKYMSLELAFDKYCSLSNNVLMSFQSIINNSSSLAFLISGTNDDSIRLLFEKISMEWKKYDSQTLHTLNEVFDFLFEHFQINNPEYKRIQTEVGENFDLEKHNRTAESLPVGKITQVIISGYSNKTGKKIKSFVEVG